jgi:hypothetical protein
MSEDEWLTVAEAARRLNISERTARRYAGQMPDTERRAPDKGPVKIRLSSLASLLPLASVSFSMPDMEGKNAGQQQKAPDNAGQENRDAGHVPDSENAAGRELVAHLQAEVSFLRAALEREQENTKGALARLEEAEARSKVLIAAAGQGRLPAPQDGGEASQASGDFSEFSSAPTRAQEGKPSEVSDKKKGFWARLWGRI